MVAGEFAWQFSVLLCETSIVGSDRMAQVPYNGNKESGWVSRWMHAPPKRAPANSAERGWQAGAAPMPPASPSSVGMAPWPWALSTSRPVWGRGAIVRTYLALRTIDLDATRFQDDVDRLL